MTIYFLAGLLISLIATYQIRAISAGSAFGAAIATFSTMVINMYVLIDIIATLQGLGAIVAFALGNTIGVYIVTSLGSRYTLP